MTPLRWRLVGLYVLILAAVIGGFSAALLFGVKRSLVEAVDRELETRARAICALVEFEGGAWFVEPKSRLPEEFAEGRGLYYLVADERGRVVLYSPLARSLELAPPAVDGARDAEWDGKRYREVALTLTKLGEVDDPEEGWASRTIRVVCGKERTPIDRPLAALTAQLAVIGPAVLILSVLGGLYLVSRALRPLKESLARQTRFTADASHELRTPLSVVSGSVELGLKRPRSAEEYREALRNIGEATDRMRSIVEGLLTLARADAQTLPVRREPVSLTTLADEMARLHRPLAQKRGVSIGVESQGDVTVTGDPDRLKDLVSNLLSNAIRYNRPGGEVTVQLAREGNRARLEVDDTGIGIPPDDLPHIFERFYRVDKARSREAGGTGLGLAIAKWIVDAHQGAISVASTPGRGSRFTVSLPS